MNTADLLKCAGVLGALATCSACGGSTVAPSTVAFNDTYAYVGKTLAVNGRLVTAARPPSLSPSYVTVFPDRHVRTKNFEYIINQYGSYASIFNYPHSTKQIGRIHNVGGQGCTNALYGYGRKIIWIVAGANQITEYEVPKKPIKTLSVSIGMPSSCAMDTNGDLAVGILAGSRSGDVVIFKNASGSGTVYTTPMDAEFFDGYDDQGNLFADGFTGYRSGFVLVELPMGGTKFKKITTSNAVGFPGSVQWDGKYLTVLDQYAAAIYRYTVSGTKAQLKDTVPLKGSGDCSQSWIVKGLVYCADSGTEGAEVFKYPAGGSATAVFSGSFDLPLGVTAAKS